MGKRSLLILFTLNWRRFLKWILHAFTGKCEIHRICSKGGWHTDTMSIQCIISIYRSRSLGPEFHDIITLPKLFDVQAKVKLIIMKKRIPSHAHIVTMNIAHCLHALRTVNAVMLNFMQLRNTAYDAINTNHQSLLENLWTAMKPLLRRTGGMITEEWGELGFQGKDPSTDFRGMGLLGLIQLEYFGTKHYEKASEILLHSNHIRRFYPYAATGINFTGLIYDFLFQRRFHCILLTKLEKYRTNIYSDYSLGGPSENDELLEVGCSIIHELYCDFFYDFHLLWEEKDPPNIMSFPKIFEEFKTSMNKLYPPLE